MYRDVHKFRKQTIREAIFKCGLNALKPINFHRILPDTEAYTSFTILFSLFSDWI